ncbi:PREDICTED: UPF0496 protein At5g66675 [Camelina sativa]|uniref:UPF0496 protein At5g66675 n=1 Tax=Camelina sativa TaxID=90675 RepID=A0ABM0XE71_CAMSA|nr:PREDICTED: UPF0496 protein At5g66675 [Camelina sativa]XP_010484604.1 PREDICTED: UPF0496 protein At5g66675 [Camelina sativa]XP_010484605.1 PREDICTED: UPF0496 protein At5g66675 [Camelina sativa]
MFLGIFSKTMEDRSNSSRNRTTNNSPPLPQIRTDIGSLYSADLSAYNSACREDPDLQSFDSSLHQRTNRVINSLASGSETRSLSFDALIEVSGCLLEMNQEVVRFIIESKEDAWDNKDLTCLVNAYFDSSIKTLDFCNAVDSCVKRARIGQMLLQFALKQFEMEESSGTNNNKSAEPRVANKYAKTLEELNKFKASGDPFDGDFFMLFESVYEQQVMLLEVLHKQKRKLDKKLKNIKHWKKISNVVFVTTFVSVLIFSVVAAAVAAPPVVTAVAAALAVPIGSIGKWCNHLWKKYETAVKGQKDIVLSMRIGAYVTMKDMDNIRVHVDKLKIEMESMMQKVDFALKEKEEEVAVRLSMHEISKKFDVFTERIEEVGENAAKCSKDITLARTIVLRHILSFPSGSDPGQGNLIEAITL